jgi:hypothetical protein
VLPGEIVAGGLPDCPLMAICMVIVGAMWSFVSIIRRSL